MGKSHSYISLEFFQRTGDLITSFRENVGVLFANHEPSNWTGHSYKLIVYICDLSIINRTINTKNILFKCPDVEHPLAKPI